MGKKFRVHHIIKYIHKRSFLKVTSTMVNKWFSTLYNNNIYIHIYRLFTKLDRH